MIYEILSASKSDLATEEALLAALKEAKPGFTVENIDSDDKEWTVRLAADGPPFEKKDEDDSSDDSDSSDSDSDSDSDSSDSDSDSDGDSDSDSDGDGDGEKSKKNPAGEVKRVIDMLTNLFTELGGHVEDLQSAHDEKDQKLKEIGDSVSEAVGGPEEGMEGMPGLGPSLEDVGPTPGKPAGPPRPPMPSKGMDRRKPGLPGAPGGGLPTFTNFQVVNHPGVDDTGNKISLTAAAEVLEADPEFEQYEVVGMTENANGSFSAKLRLKTLND